MSANAPIVSVDDEDNIMSITWNDGRWGIVLMLDDDDVCCVTFGSPGKYFAQEELHKLEAPRGLYKALHAALKGGSHD